MARVDFYHSIGSRYSYLASTQLGRLEAETGCRFEWRPVNGPRLIARRADDPFANPSPTGQYAPEYRARDLVRWAAHYGVPYVEPTGRVRFDSQELALACTAASRLGAASAVSRGLYAAMYAGSVSAIDRAECIRIAASCGLDASRFAAELDSQETREQLERTIDEAARRGVFGVPTFAVGEELFWGNDRLVVLRDHLLAAKPGRGSDRRSR